MYLQNNNHFYTRPSCLIPKELFPATAVHRKESTSSSKSAVTMQQHQRSVRLPLRKHHSFHFQPSQTVAGVIKSHKRRHHPRTDAEVSSTTSPPTSILGARRALGASTTSLSHLTGLKARLAANGDAGPLIFKPYDENSAFKPIQPITTTARSSGGHHTNNSYSSSGYNNNKTNNNHSFLNNKSMPISTNVMSSSSLLDSSQESTSINTNTSSDAKSTTSSSSSSDRQRKMPKMALGVTQRVSSQRAAAGIDKRLVYADLLDTSKSDGIDPHKVNCVPKPSRTQYATISFPEVNI